jgi:uncharacterized membrane protein (DUF485 family)
MTFRIIYGSFISALLIWSTLHSISSVKHNKSMEKEDKTVNIISSIIVMLIYVPFIIYTSFN